MKCLYIAIDYCLMLWTDIQYSRTYTSGPIIPYDTALSYSSRAMEGLNTLTGACLPLFIKMYRIARLTKQRQETSAWGDEALVDIVAAAEEVELELQAEKRRMDSLVQGTSDLLVRFSLLIGSEAIACLSSIPP